MAPPSQSELEQRLDECRRDYDAAKARLLEIGFICEGSLVERWISCGKPSCRCVDPARRHGPYYQLSWKEAGQTVSRRLSPEQALLYREWIDNRRRLESFLQQMRDVSGKARTQMLAVAPPYSPVRPRRSRPSELRPTT